MGFFGQKPVSGHFGMGKKTHDTRRKAEGNKIRDKRIASPRFAGSQ